MSQERYVEIRLTEFAVLENQKIDNISVLECGSDFSEYPDENNIIESILEKKESIIVDYQGNLLTSGDESENIIRNRIIANLIQISNPNKEAYAKTLNLSYTSTPLIKPNGDDCRGICPDIVTEMSYELYQKDNDECR